MNQIKEVMELECAPKYLQQGESFHEGMSRIADTLKDSPEHFKQTQEILLNQRFLPAGRIQASVGAARQTTAFNCFASDTIEDSMSGIMVALSDAAETMRLGGGDGFDFSTLRPKGDLIKSLGSTSSGPISFMGVWDAMCETIKSAGHRRGAMMGVMRVDHPDIEEFITCKQQNGKLTNFNISVAVTDKFIAAVKEDLPFELSFEGVVHNVVSARMLWNKIMRNTWEHAEPGVLFMDKINQKNNMWYLETIATTNPCAEQPLPPNGACLLGSFNLTKYIIQEAVGDDDPLDLSSVVMSFDYNKFQHDITPIVRMMDNVVDRTIYPLDAQRLEAESKRRMGLGVTGVANAAEILGLPYGSEEMLLWMRQVMTLLRDTAYIASVGLAVEKGPFPLFDAGHYVSGEFIQTLPEEIQTLISQHGIRNSHLLSIAPTGTISLWAQNISSGIEPPFALAYNRKIRQDGGSFKEYYVEDYAYSEYGVKGRTSDEISAQDHIKVLCLASELVDSACSKTCNVGDHITFDEFKDLYIMAYDGGASGCTTFRPSSFEGAILTKIEEKDGDSEADPVVDTESQQELDFSTGPGTTNTDAGACFINPLTGERSCSD
ncbi:MAG: adenosylcobalamin-dependent ribonucleoside-diphosphate reductase [Crocinitomix sp.]|nr:adenosylcobalamin-dependent ribonucleoside-diphosphate reductase [Crocinitomix sp.]